MRVIKNSMSVLLLGLPIPGIHFHGPSASSVILVEGESKQVSFGNLQQALAAPDTQLRLFGKPEVSGHRRMGVALARAATTELARERAAAAGLDRANRALVAQETIIAGMYVTTRAIWVARGWLVAAMAVGAMTSLRVAKPWPVTRSAARAGKVRAWLNTR
mgnify:CR=1 FL=1